MSIFLNWHGPFTFVPGSTIPYIFDQEVAKSAGLYLWTIEVDGQFLVNYVGLTDRSFEVRLEEEARYLLGGGDSMSDPDLIVKGVRKRIPTPGIREFLLNYNHWSQRLIHSLERTRLFLAPLKVEAATLHRVESGLIRRLKGVGDPCRQFLANKKCLPASSEPLRVTMTFPVTIAGLEAAIDV